MPGFNKKAGQSSEELEDEEVAELLGMERSLHWLCDLLVLTH